MPGIISLSITTKAVYAIDRDELLRLIVSLAPPEAFDHSMSVNNDRS